MDCVAHWAPLSMGFPSQEYWSGLPFPSPGDLPDPGFKPRSPALQADSLPSHQESPVGLSISIKGQRSLNFNIQLNAASKKFFKYKETD